MDLAIVFIPLVFVFIAVFIIFVALCIQFYISKHLVYKPERDQLFEKLAKKYDLRLVLDTDKMALTFQSALKGLNFARKIEGTIGSSNVLVGDFAKPLIYFNVKQSYQYKLSPFVTKFFLNGKEKFPSESLLVPTASEEEISAFLDSIK